MKKDSFIECFFELTVGIWEFFCDTFLAGLLPAGICCLPSLLCWFGLAKVGFITFIVLLSIYGIMFVFILVTFIVARVDEDVNQQSRCFIMWAAYTGAIVIGTIVAKLAGVF